MSRKGDCWDNAMAESFFKTLKVELGRCFSSRVHARREVFDYIECFYNTRRLHSSLGYRSPAEFERLGPSRRLGRQQLAYAPNPDREPRLHGRGHAGAAVHLAEIEVGHGERHAYRSASVTPTGYAEGHFRE
jgi:hypothetical protein